MFHWVKGGQKKCENVSRIIKMVLKENFSKYVCLCLSLSVSALFVKSIFLSVNVQFTKPTKQKNKTVSPNR